MLSREALRVYDRDWNAQLEKVLAALTTLTALRRLSAAVTSAESGLQLLGTLTRTRPDIAEAVGRSREVIAITEAQLTNLGLLKRVHDSLHTVEADCLRPLQTGGFTIRVRPFQTTFLQERKKIQAAAASEEVRGVLPADLLDDLDAVATAFTELLKPGDRPAYDALVGALIGLLSHSLDKVDQCMVATARQVKLERLCDLIISVQEKTGAPADGPSSLRPLAGAADGLKQLQLELEQRVAEHTLLQDLDSRLRAVCEGGGLARSAIAEWPGIRRARSRLGPSYSPELIVGLEQMEPAEKEIEAAVAAGSGSDVMPLMVEYFWIVSTVFRQADQELLKVSGRLSGVSLPLKTILTNV
jgi:hypothetical protein